MSVAELQNTLGQQWAEVYAKEPVKSAEIALRNPAVYLQDVALSSLPGELQAGWTELLDTAEKVVAAAETTKSQWADDVNSIHKLQDRIFTGNLKSEYREPVADIIRDASSLFARSSQLRAGNTSYYAGNVQGMQGWLKRYQ